MERREYNNKPVIFELTTSKDVEDLVTLENDAFKGSGEDIFTLGTIGKVGWILGLKDIGGKLIGAVEMIRSKNMQEGFIHGVVVDSDFQYHGIGNQLISSAVEKAKLIGMVKLSATISPQNGPSLNAFINKNGFIATKFVPDCYGKGEDRFWVEIDLVNENTSFQQKMLFLKKEPEAVIDTDHKTLHHLLDNGYVAIGLVHQEEQPNFIYLVEKGEI